MTIDNRDPVFEQAMALHASFCDRKDKPHQCVGQATIRRGEVCLDCPLCGKGERHPWRPQLVHAVESIWSAAGVDFYALNRERQVAVMDKLQDVIDRESGKR